MLWVSVIFIFVAVVSISGLVAHFLFMRKRTRLDDSRTKLREMRDDQNITDEEYFKAEDEYDLAKAEYNAYILRPAGRVIAFLVGLGRE